MGPAIGLAGAAILKRKMLLPVLTEADFMSKCFVAKFARVGTFSIVRPPGANQSNIFTLVVTDDQSPQLASIFRLD